MTQIAFSPSGRQLASAGDDNTVRVWDSATGEQIGTRTGHSPSASALAFSPDGRVLATDNGQHSSGDFAGVDLWAEIPWSDARELQTRVCDVLRAGFARSDWVPAIDYRRSCP